MSFSATLWLVVFVITMRLLFVNGAFLMFLQDTLEYKVADETKAHLNRKRDDDPNNDGYTWHVPSPRWLYPFIVVDVMMICVIGFWTAALIPLYLLWQAKWAVFVLLVSGLIDWICVHKILVNHSGPVTGVKRIVPFLHSIKYSFLWRWALRPKGPL